MQAENGFYFPQSEKEALEFRAILMNPSFTFSGCDLDFMIKTGVTLKVIFHSLAHGDTVKPVVTTRLSILLTTLTDKIADLKYDFWGRDQRGKCNQENSSTTDKTFDEIKLHPRYQKIREVLSHYQGTDEENKKIDQTIKRIIKKKDGKTLKKYQDIKKI